MEIIWILQVILWDCVQENHAHILSIPGETRSIDFHSFFHVAYLTATRVLPLPPQLWDGYQRYQLLFTQQIWLIFTHTIDRTCWFHTGRHRVRRSPHVTHFLMQNTSSCKTLDLYGSLLYGRLYTQCSTKWILKINTNVIWCVMGESQVW